MVDDGSITPQFVSFVLVSNIYQYYCVIQGSIVSTTVRNLSFVPLDELLTPN